MSKLGAAGLIFDDHGRILLVHRRDMDLWNLPSGGVEDGETPWEAVIRETKEESGFDVEVVSLTGVYFKTPTLGTNFSFLCRIIGGQPTLNAEADRIEFFDTEHLPANTSTRQVERIQDYLRDKNHVYLKKQDQLT
jgi:8-oxo-dGTP pyrophosphatase MutT (NUDIX family)